LSPLLSLELPYPNKSGNRQVRHGGGRHYFSENAQDYRRQVEKVVMKRRAVLKLAGPHEMRGVIAPLDVGARERAIVLKLANHAIDPHGVLSGPRTMDSTHVHALRTASQ
jgi:hypothetical protein